MVENRRARRVGTLNGFDRPALPSGRSSTPPVGRRRRPGFTGRAAAEHPAGAPGGRQTNGRAKPGRAQLDPFVYMAPKDKCA